MIKFQPAELSSYSPLALHPHNARLKLATIVRNQHARTPHRLHETLSAASVHLPENITLRMFA